MPNPVLIPIEDVELTLTFPDESTEPFTLEAPNAEGESIFFIDFVRLPILANYPSADYQMQRGFYKYQLQAQYSYSDHQMNLFRLIAASNIELKFPPTFGDAENYQTADVMLENRRGVRNYLNGLAMASPNEENSDDANVVPAGSVTLNFIGKKALTESEMLSYTIFE